MQLRIGLCKSMRLDQRLNQFRFQATLCIFKEIFMNFLSAASRCKQQHKLRVTDSTILIFISSIIIISYIIKKLFRLLLLTSYRSYFIMCTDIANNLSMYFALSHRFFERIGAVAEITLAIRAPSEIEIKFALRTLSIVYRTYCQSDDLISFLYTRPKRMIFICHTWKYNRHAH